jgi:hypothetical protein
MREIVRNFGMKTRCAAEEESFVSLGVRSRIVQKAQRSGAAFPAVKGGVVCFHVLKNSILCLWALSKSPLRFARIFKFFQNLLLGIAAKRTRTPRPFLGKQFADTVKIKGANDFPWSALTYIKGHLHLFVRDPKP